MNNSFHDITRHAWLQHRLQIILSSSNNSLLFVIQNAIATELYKSLIKIGYIYIYLLLYYIQLTADLYDTDYIIFIYT